SGEHPVPRALVPPDHLARGPDAPLHEQACAADQRIGLQVGDHLLWGSVRGLDVGAGMTKEAYGPQMEERWLAAPPHEVHRLRRGLEGLREVGAVGSEV